MNSLKQFFIFCSGADTELLQHPECRTEHGKYVGVGATVFFTALFASISAGYALNYVFEKPLLSGIIGLVWGSFIFSLDRYIVSTLRKGIGWWRELIIAMPRFVLAAFLALIISKPLELKIFEKEIENELVAMQAEVRKEQDAKITQQLQASVPQVQTEISRLKEEIEAKRKARDLLAEEARKEGDGTAGSGKIGKGPQYEIKKADANRAEQELQQIIALNQPLIAQKLAEIQGRQNLTNKTLETQKRAELNGLLSRIEALSRLTAKSEAMLLAKLAVLLLFICLETAPVVVKLLSPSGPYDYKLLALEKRIREQEIAASDRLIAKSKYDSKLESTKLGQTFEQDLQYDLLLHSKIKEAEVTVANAVLEKWREQELAKLRLRGLNEEELVFPNYKDGFPKPPVKA